jgi:hypothetical protein
MPQVERNLMSDEILKQHIRNQAESDGSYAIAWAILQLIKESEKASGHVATAILQAATGKD